MSVLALLRLHVLPLLSLLRESLPTEKTVHCAERSGTISTARKELGDETRLTVLKRDSLGLGQEKVRPEKADSEHASEQEVGYRSKRNISSAFQARRI